MASVSIVIPTHSRPHLLARAVESARAASRDPEIIIVDDASTDATREVCASLPGIKYLRLDRNQRVAGARNIGILASTTDYIAFLDDDDLRLPGSLDRQIALLESAPEAGFIYSPVELVDQDGRLLGRQEPRDRPSGDLFWFLLERNCVYPCSAVVRKSCFYRIGLLNPAAAGFDEWDLWVRIAELFPVLLLDEPVAHYRAPDPNSDQLTTAMSVQLGLGMLQHQMRLLQLPRAVSAPQEQRHALRRRTINRNSDRLIFTASQALASGMRAEARKRLLAALRLNPTRAARPGTARLLFQSLLPGHPASTRSAAS
jgi:hypothetical protein